MRCTKDDIVREIVINALGAGVGRDEVIEVRIEMIDALLEKIFDMKVKEVDTIKAMIIIKA